MFSCKYLYADNTYGQKTSAIALTKEYMNKTSFTKNKAGGGVKSSNPSQVKLVTFKFDTFRYLAWCSVVMG